MAEEILTRDLLCSFQVAKVFKDSSRNISSLDWDDEGKLLLACSEEESMRIYDCVNGRLFNTVHSKKYGCAHASFTHRSNNLIYASTKNEDAIRYMSLHDNKYISYFKGHESLVTSLRLSPVNDTFISASNDNTVRMWDLRQKSSTGVIQTGGQRNALLAYDPSGKVFALGLGNNSVRMYNLQTEGSGPFLSKSVIDPLKPSFQPEWTKISFSNDGKYLLISTVAGVLYLLDAFECEIVHRFSGHLNSAGVAFEASFTPDAKFVLCGSQDGKIHMYDVNTGQKLGDVAWHSDPPKVVRFSPKSLLFASADSNLALWTPPPI